MIVPGSDRTMTSAPDTATPVNGDDADLRRGLTAVAVAIMAWGMSGVLVKSIDMGAIAIAAWRFTIYAAILTAWLHARGGRLDLRVVRKAAPGGLPLALDVMLFFTAVRLTNVVNATTIGALQPLVVAGIAVRWFGERITRREVGAAVAAIVGVVVVITQSSGTPSGAARATWPPLARSSRGAATSSRRSGRRGRSPRSSSRSAPGGGSRRRRFPSASSPDRTCRSHPPVNWSPSSRWSPSAA